MQTSINSVTTNNSQNVSTSRSTTIDSAKNPEKASFKDELNKTNENQPNESEMSVTNEQQNEDVSNKKVGDTEPKNDESSNKQTLQDNSSNKQNPSELSKELTSIAEAIQNRNLNHVEKVSTLGNSINSTEPFTLYISKGITSDGQTYDMPAVSMTKEDALFFVGLASGDFQQNVNQLSATNSTGSTASVASTQLITILNQAMQDNQPVRIDFDNNISVILKVDKEGKISANFIPGDTAVENYLRNNIQFLRQTFDEKGLAYNELTYKQSKQGNKEQHQNKEQQKDE